MQTPFILTKPVFPPNPQTVMCFILKKTLLAYTTPFPLAMGMLMSGYWVEHITDIVCC